VEDTNRLWVGVRRHGDRLGIAQERKSAGFFELRVYMALPGKRNALASRFASRTGFFLKFGAGLDTIVKLNSP
jgi:hypothetical protein